ncbi:signal recognition particle subunit Srp72 [Schizosaccharomyces cryophilus OY26]|uniref:Signal recognition particle subunit SRP72 n=1 Tax=Schizosaccharomyces cryophilus (strain OY26 / ATCC MYA-4695 / CBS 11777 / NBRC 106824 / NRRL Y48691) TaxID=653667 RepID=S9VV50_SCHCR|nr:signal recognition particle subunit Srp72 [Schizosaccharomyces cryophilus OY26]EPY50069.1 signal recognition particle subunit Srp72 [Schizosaccharomyces cryophilus OY26]
MADTEEQITTLADRVGKIEVGDSKIDIYRKVLNLIDVECYVEALDVIQKYLGGQDAMYERVYCAFHLKQDYPAINDSHFIQHLEAQEAYRKSDFSKAIEIYEKLQRELPEQQSDIQVNVLAVASQLPGWQIESIPSLEDQDSQFNLATRYLTLQQWSKAIDLLSSLTGNLEAKDSLSSEEESHVNLCRLQLVYAHLMAGEVQKAEEESKKIASASLDETSRVLFVNNVLCLNNENPYLAFRNIHETPVEKAFTKLLASQSLQLVRNLALLDMAVGKVRAVHKKEKERRAQEDKLFYGVLMSEHEKGSLSSSKKLPGFLINKFRKNPADACSALLLIQFKISCENYRGALAVYKKMCGALEGSENFALRYSPGMAGLGDALLSKVQHSQTPSTENLHAAARYWTGKPNCHAKLLLCTRSLLASIDEKASVDVVQSGLKTIEKLIAWRGPVSELVSSEVAALCYIDESISKSLESHLISVSDLIGSVDIDAVESKGVPVSTTIGSLKREANNDASKKTRKRRKPTPKNFNPNTAADPQRWLPKRDRTNVKIKNKGRNMQGIAT